MFDTPPDSRRLSCNYFATSYTEPVQRLYPRDVLASHADTGSHIDVADAMSFSRNGDVSVELCMISTPDGVTDVGGRSGPLGGPVDQEVLLTLRANADVVLVGAGTVRAEHYKAPVRAPLPIVAVTRSCNLDFESSLFTSGWGMLATTVNAPPTPVRTFRAGEGDVDLSSIIQQLRSELNARVIHVEGGPDLNTSLLRANLVDAINLTISPCIGNGGSSIMATLTNAPPMSAQRFSITQLCRDNDYVFVRYECNK
jgi:riboflavin biosynthesis pyrimidine reductase